MRVEVCIIPRYTTVEKRGGKLILPAEPLNPDRVVATCYDDLDAWIRDVSVRMVVSGMFKYHVAIKDLEQEPKALGYSHYAMPKLPTPIPVYTPIAKAIWHLVDLHVSFEMGVPSEHLRHAP